MDGRRTRPTLLPPGAPSSPSSTYPHLKDCLAFQMVEFENGTPSFSALDEEQKAELVSAAKRAPAFPKPEAPLKAMELFCGGGGSTSLP